MLPAADVVAGPDGGVALDTGVAGTGQDERTLRGALPSQPLAERRVGGIHLHPWIKDGDDFEALLREIADEPARRGKAAGREGEDAIAVHIVYVEPERVAGDLA